MADNSKRHKLVSGGMITHRVIAMGILAAISVGSAEALSAAIVFEDVTRHAGVIGTGPTFGAAWGDFNGDGWPDLWVGNHWRQPTLYLNRRDGTFANITTTVWSGNPDADAHGAAWADFDNDGDQDLIELVGASYGRGEGPNHLYVNEEGKLTDRAQASGVSDPLGRGRTPLWVDVDRNGFLDLVVMNASRADEKAPSQLFLQREKKFLPAGTDTGFRDPKRSLWDKGVDYLRNLRNFQFGRPPVIYGHASFAQIARLSDESGLDLLLFAPLRIYSLKEFPLRDITYQRPIPRITDMKDVTVADFDGDGVTDLFVAQASPATEAVAGDRELRIAMRGEQGARCRTFRFKTDADVDLEWDGGPTFPDEMIVGGRVMRTAKKRIKASPADASVADFTTVDCGTVRGIVLVYDRGRANWVLALPQRDFDLRIRSKRIRLLENVERSTLGKSSTVGHLLLTRAGGFESRAVHAFIGPTTGCNSVGAGDFDNDGDVDLYLVCTGSAANAPNVLLENIGTGHFRQVADTGRAAGTSAGIGDSVTVADFDRDGFLDLLITNGDGRPLFAENGPLQLFRNNGNKSHWIEIVLVGKKTNRDGIGARLVLDAGGTRQLREQNGGMHNIAQNDKTIHFGLSEKTTIDLLTIVWPSGITQTVRNLKADKFVVVEETENQSSVSGPGTRRGVSGSLDSVTQTPSGPKR